VGKKIDCVKSKKGCHICSNLCLFGKMAC